MTIEMFMGFAERLGTPLAILVVFGIAVWRVLKWLGDKVVAPITASHIALVNETRECNKTNSQTLKQMTNLLQIYTTGMSQVVAQGAESAKAAAIAADMCVKIHAQGEKILDGVIKVDEKLTAITDHMAPKLPIKTTTTTTIQEPLKE